RGLAPAIALTAAAVRPALAEATLAVVLGGGKGVAAPVAALVKGGLPRMTVSRLAWSAVLLLTGCAAGAGLYGQRRPQAAAPPAVKPAAPRAAEAPPPAAPDRLAGGPFWHGGRITTLTFSADGKALAALGMDGTIQVWKVPTGDPVRQVRWAMQMPTEEID